MMATERRIGPIGQIRRYRVLAAGVADHAIEASFGRLQIQFVHKNLDYFVREMGRSSNRVSFAIVIGAIVIGSAVVVHAGIGPLTFGYPALGFGGFVMATGGRGAAQEAGCVSRRRPVD